MEYRLYSNYIPEEGEVEAYVVTDKIVVSENERGFLLKVGGLGG